MDEKLKEKYRIFIGKNADYYLKKFEVFEKTGSSLSWNWAAFGFGIFWMVYRKMYLYAFLSMLLIFFINILEVSLRLSPLLSFFLSLWLWVGFGLFGNYLYYLHVKKKVMEIIIQYPKEDEQKLILEKEGGTSWLSVFIFVFIFILASGILGSYLENRY